MRSALLKLLIAVPLLFLLTHKLSAQDGFYTGLNGMVIDLPCGQNCVSSVFKVPHLKTTSDYAVNRIDYVPFPYRTSAPSQFLNCPPPGNDQDDKYFEVTTLPFKFCFFDSVFDKLVVSTNGSLSFDISNAERGANWALNAGMVLPFEGTGTQGTAGTCPLPSGTRLPKAGIFGVFCDIFPDLSDPGYKIEARVEGTAPWRRFVVSFSAVPMFGCTSQRMTSQIVIHESTALIDIFIENKPSCGSNGGLAIVGIQNYALGTPNAKGVTAPGRGANNGPWTAINEAWRFTPSGSVSRFVSCEILSMTGTLIATGDTITTEAGLLDVTFPNFCQTLPSSQYVIKTTYSACDNVNNQIVVRDTITVNRTTELNATVAYTPTSCGVNGTGTATITVPPGVGTAPFTYVLTPGGVTQTSNQFTALTAGDYSVTVTDNGGGCSSTLPFTIVSSGNLAVTYTVTNTSCAGAANGSITVNPPDGTPPITYSINGGPFTTNNVFNNLAPAVYFVTTRDAAGCSKEFDPVNVLQGSALSITTSVTPTSCPGAANGSITVTGVLGGGTAPYQYSINGGPSQASNVFTGLVNSATPYLITVRDALGCMVSNVPVTVTAGNNTVTGTANGSSTSCAGATDGTVTVTAVGTGPFEYSINGGTNWQTSNVFTGLGPGGYSVLIREGGICVSAPVPATVSVGSGLQVDVNVTPASCTGASNGAIQLNPSTGTPPFTFVLNGTTTQTGASANFTNLAAGSYTITVTDANGCTTASPLGPVVGTGAGFTATYTSTNSTCTGATNGSITVTPGTGGTAPYTFVLGTTTQTGTTNTTFNNLAAGSYNILITDASGCQFTLNNATVTAGAGFTATYTSTNSTCPGAANGSVTVTPDATGTPPYTFVLGTTTQTGTTNTTFTNLVAGNHTILITDANGCQYTVNAVVTAGAGFNATPATTATSCSGATDGTITVTPDAAGTAPFTFVLDGAVTQTGNTNTVFTGLAAGTHSVVITDANGCQVTLNTIDVPAGPPLDVVLTRNNTTCPGVNDGSVIATVTNGSAPYTFVLDGTVTQTSTTNTTTFTGLVAGAHTMVVTDAGGCSISVPAFDIASGSGILADITRSATSCAGATNGTITISATNGTAPFTYVLNGTVTQTSNTGTVFTNLAPGTTYMVVITDAIGCTGTFSNISVPQGAPLTIHTDEISTTCNTAANGQITVQAFGGGGPYTFVLDGAISQTGTNSTTFTGVGAGDHNIVVTDVAGCVSGPIPSTVNPGPAIAVTPAKVDATCFGLSSGSINAVASANATAPVEFSINNTTWQSAPNFGGLPANTYTVYIRDAAGCTNSATVTVGQPAQLTLTPSAQAVSCNGQTDGRLTINATGGTPAYAYSLDNTNFQPGNQFQVPAGIYTAYIRDANSCTAMQDNIVVTEPDVLTATAVGGNATCDGGNDGTITVTPTGGTAPYQYAIAGSGSYQPSAILNVAPGTYDVDVRDASGCIYQITGVNVGLTDNLTFTPMTDPAPICEGSTVQLQANSNAGIFSWTPSGDLSSSSVSNPVATPSTTTTYTVSMTLGRCTLTDDVTVTVMPAPVADAGAPGTICYGQSYQLQAIGDPSYTYTWSPDTYLSSATGQTVTAVNPEKTMVYKLTVTDNNGCQSLTPGEVTVVVTQPLPMLVSPVDTVVHPGVLVPLFAAVPAALNATYTWSPATGLNNPFVQDPVATVSFNIGDVITYHVVATGPGACIMGEADVTIKVYRGPDIYVPNAFTPNSDGKNDKFIPYPVGIQKLNYFRVFNRWGQMVYTTTTLNEGWNGRTGNVEQATGVYTWMVEGVTTDGQKITKRGVVTLIR